MSVEDDDQVGPPIPVGVTVPVEQIAEKASVGLLTIGFSAQVASVCSREAKLY